MRDRSIALRTLLGVLLAVLVATSSCSAGSAPNNTTELPTVAEGFSVALFASGLNRPTQMVFAPNGDLVVAELAGAENDGTGRILRVQDTNVSQAEVLQDGLDKPTGIAIVGDTLWIMERRRLSVTTLVAGAERIVVADDLPYNGRSEGTLTPTPDGGLLFNTSGSKSGATRVEGSATIFLIERPTLQPSEPVPFATGFKHAYAHTFEASGQLWSVEMTDGTFDGTRASDELVAVDRGQDFGWPQCVDSQRAVPGVWRQRGDLRGDATVARPLLCGGNPDLYRPCTMGH